MRLVRVTVLSLLVSAPVLTLAAASASATSAPLPTGTIYVTNLNANTVSAIDAKTHAVTVIGGTSGEFRGPLGIAVTPDGTTAYVTNSLSNTVTPINLRTTPPTVGHPIRVGSGPAAVAITPNGNFAYVTNFNSNTVTPINLRTTPPTPESPIAVGPGPWSVAASPDGKYVCVSNSESDSVSIISVTTRTVTTVHVGGRPQAIAISPNAFVAYVANGSSITPINLRTVPATLEAPIILSASSVGITMTPDGTKAYSANADNTVTPINLTTSPPTLGTPVTIGSLSQPDGIAVNTNGNLAYSANANGTVTPIDLTSSPIHSLTPIYLGTASFGIAVLSDQAPTARLKVTPAAAGKSTILDASKSTSPDGRIVRYAWNFGDGKSAVTTTPRLTHVYAKAGAYVATVTVTSAGGTSTATTYTGQTVSNNGGARARAQTSFSVPAVLQLQPPTGSPGLAITLRDAAFTGRCKPVAVLFDKNLVAEVTPIGGLLLDRHLVIPGNASLGRHTISVACTPTGRRLSSVSLLVVAASNHLSEFSVALPTFGQLKHNLPGAGLISILLLLLSRLVGAGFPSEWLDRTYEENRERFRRPLKRRFPRLFAEHTVEKPLPRRILDGSLMFVAFAAFGGFINSFLDPSFGFNRTGLWLFLGQCVGIAIISVAVQIPSVILAFRQRREVHLQILAGGLVIAVACVAASRLIGLSPGYCYGLIATFLVIPEQSSHEQGRLHAYGSVVVLVLSTIAFLVNIPVLHAATSPSPSPFVLILAPALGVTFLAGFASLAFSMFPLPFMPGRHVAKWNSNVWLILGGLGLIGFVAVLLSPGSGSSGELHHVGLGPILTAFLAFAAISVAAIVYFHYHPIEKEEELERETESDHAQLADSTTEAVDGNGGLGLA